MTRLLQKLTGGYGFESAAEAARILLARYDVNKDGVLDKKEADALKAGALRGARTNNCLADDLTLPLCPVCVSRLCACARTCVRVCARVVQSLGSASQTPSSSS